MRRISCLWLALRLTWLLAPTFWLSILYSCLQLLKLHFLFSSYIRTLRIAFPDKTHFKMMSPAAKFVLLSTLAGGIVATSSPAATTLDTRELTSDSTSIPTLSTSSSAYKIPFKTGHGPVVTSTSVPALTLHDPKLSTPTIISSPTYDSVS